jgi:hypothetical protein
VELKSGPRRQFAPRRDSLEFPRADFTLSYEILAFSRWSNAPAPADKPYGIGGRSGPDCVFSGE